MRTRLWTGFVWLVGASSGLCAEVDPVLQKPPEGYEEAIEIALDEHSLQGRKIRIWRVGASRVRGDESGIGKKMISCTSGRAYAISMSCGEEKCVERVVGHVCVIPRWGQTLLDVEQPDVLPACAGKVGSELWLLINDSQKCCGTDFVAFRFDVEGDFSLAPRLGDALVWSESAWPPSASGTLHEDGSEIEQVECIVDGAEILLIGRQQGVVGLIGGVNTSAPKGVPAWSKFDLGRSPAADDYAPAGTWLEEVIHERELRKKTEEPDS